MIEEKIRTGKTTRAVDEAIQTLFQKGKIYIPSFAELSNQAPFPEPLVNMFDYMIVDPDWEKGGTVQRHLETCILNRFSREHPHAEIKFSGNWILLK